MTKYLVLLLLAGAHLSAQAPPTIAVLGVGTLAFDVEAPSLQAAKDQVYRAYIDTRPPVKLDVVCTGDKSPYTCAVPLSSLSLVSTHSLALTASVVAVDGELEGPKIAVPFVLRRVGTPVGPAAASIRVMPK